ncbi:MAG: hypothetical protein RL616_577 [Verrucomicrobiota bacterium]
MRIAYFDSGDPEMYFDNPNLRWADPAYLLEPGDPGYVDPFPSATNQHNQRKKNKMKRHPYYPHRQADEIVWLTNFINKISTYATTLGLTAGQVTAIKADCLWLIYLLQIWLPAVRNWAQSGTDALKEAQSGTGSSAQVLPVFTAPTVPTGTAAALPGALLRVFTFVQDIKESGKATEAIATDLGIIGGEVTGPDPATLKPVISATVSGGQVLIKWGWGGHGAFLDSCEIHVDRNDSHGFVLLTIDTTPNYTDTQSFPAAPTSWSYRAIYRTGDQRTGLWSATVSVAVPN